VYSRSEGATTCPDERALRAAVAERLGYDPFVGYATTTVVAEVFREGAKLRARARLVDGSGISHGARELAAETDDCRPLLTALALAISIALDPPAAIGAPKAAANPVETSRPAGDGSPAPKSDEENNIAPSPSRPTAPDPRAELAETRSRAESPPPPARPTSRSLPLRASAGLFVSRGSLPATATGASLDLAVRLASHWSIGLEGQGVLPAGIDASRNGRVEAWMWTTSLVPCYRVGMGRLCALATGGQIVAHAEGVTDPKAKTAFYPALGARVGARWEISEGWDFDVHGDLVAPLARTTLALGGTDVWQAPAVSGSIGAGISVGVW
jgi:hypothetical protein